MIIESRLEVANTIIDALLPDLKAFASSYRGSLYIQWEIMGEVERKRWQTLKGGVAPVFELPCNSVFTLAIAALLSWVRDRPCLPLSVWGHWEDDESSISVIAAMAIPLLRASGYPENVNCHGCGRVLSNGFEWWVIGNKPLISCYGGCASSKPKPVTRFLLGDDVGVE
jgi:hypothetical protein